MPLVAASNLPIAPRDTPWDATGAARRVAAACTTPASLGRAFLWRTANHDGSSVDGYRFQIADMIQGRLQIVPRAVAQAAGIRGIAYSTLPDPELAKLRDRIDGLYQRIRDRYPDWPPSPFTVAASITAAAGDPNRWEGVIALEGETTGDGRRIAKGALTWENGPWPLIFDLHSLGHVGMVVGTIDTIRREGMKIIGTGTLSESEEPQTAAAVTRVRELLLEGAVGVSVNLDDTEETMPDEDSDEPMVTTSGRIRHVAIVDIPAFDRARVALVAAADRSWFADPGFGDDTDPRLVLQIPERPEETRSLGAPFTVEESGQVWGHFALWNRCHVGSPGTCVTPPREPASFRGFLTGSRFDGVATGPIVMRTTHAPLGHDLATAQQHYAHTGQAVADVTVGADQYGLWAAGALRVGVDDAMVEALRGSALSGDWRPIGGKHRLIGLLAVNAPGFRVSRAIAASGALIANGPGCDLCDEQMSLEERLAEVERKLAQLT